MFKGSKAHIQATFLCQHLFLLCLAIDMFILILLLQDFGFDDIQNLASAFDKLFHKIIDPIVDAVNTVKELIVMVKDMTFVDLVNEIVKIFKDLPSIIEKIVNAVIDSFSKIKSFDGYPLVTKFKALVTRVMTFITDIKSDVLGFYHVSSNKLV